MSYTTHVSSSDTYTQRSTTALQSKVRFFSLQKRKFIYITHILLCKTTIYIVVCIYAVQSKFFQAWLSQISTDNTMKRDN